MRMSPFRIGLVVTVVGMGISACLFLDAGKTGWSFSLDAAQTESAEMILPGRDIGFFRVYAPDFVRGSAVFVQVLDPSGNVIADKKIQTKMAINYFDVDEGGAYTVRATNLSQDPSYLEIEFGGTNARQVAYPGVAILAGVVLIVVSAYNKLKSYITAQPDENIA